MEEDNKKRYRDEWKKIVDEYLHSKMTQKEFCKQYNINLSQLVYYHNQFKQDKTIIKKPSFSPVKIPNRDKPSEGNDIKLLLPNGFQCSFSSNIDVAQIKKIVEMLLSC